MSYSTIAYAIMIMRNSTLCKTLGMCRFIMFDASIQTFGDLRCVMDLKLNFILLSTLDSKELDFFLVKVKF